MCFITTFYQFFISRLLVNSTFSTKWYGRNIFVLVETSLSHDIIDWQVNMQKQMKFVWRGGTQW